MKKQALFMVVLLAAVGSARGSRCEQCARQRRRVHHALRAAATARQGAAPGVTPVSNNGTTATYSVSAATAFEWAVFNGATHRRHALRSTGRPAIPRRAVASPCPWEPPIRSTPSMTRRVWRLSVRQINVSPAGATNYTVTPTAGANGSISPDSAQTVASGGNVTFTITPRPATTSPTSSSTVSRSAPSPRTRSPM